MRTRAGDDREWQAANRPRWAPGPKRPRGYAPTNYRRQRARAALHQLASGEKCAAATTRSVEPPLRPRSFDDPPDGLHCLAQHGERITVGLLGTLHDSEL